jgi:valyl-tRNA synthetase
MKIMKTSAAFCNKIWQATRFFLQALDRVRPEQLSQLENFAQGRIL